MSSAAVRRYWNRVAALGCVCCGWCEDFAEHAGITFTTVSKVFLAGKRAAAAPPREPARISFAHSALDGPLLLTVADAAVEKMSADDRALVVRLAQADGAQKRTARKSSPFLADRCYALGKAEGLTDAAPAERPTDEPNPPTARDLAFAASGAEPTVGVNASPAERTDEATALLRELIKNQDGLRAAQDARQPLDAALDRMTTAWSAARAYLAKQPKEAV